MTGADFEGREGMWLPKSLRELGLCAELDLSGCGLSRWPPGLELLTHLRTLDVSSNSLVSASAPLRSNLKPEALISEYPK